MTVRVDLSEAGDLYLIAFDANGKERLLWPAKDDERSTPLPGAAPHDENVITPALPEPRR